MANSEHLAILKQGVEEWNQWRRSDPRMFAPDLSAAYLNNANLQGANLSGAILRKAELRRANLQRGLLTRAILQEADLSGANLQGAILNGTLLNGANLTDANLQGAMLAESNLTRATVSGADLGRAFLPDANFAGATLSAADFTGAVIRGTRFVDVDLSSVKGLETLRHQGPSTIGIDTLYRSGGQIPELFLRGCGVSDEFILYLSATGGRPIENCWCFITYASPDQTFAEQLHGDLEAGGVRCWLMPDLHNLENGRKPKNIWESAIHPLAKLLVIVSEHSMSSRWLMAAVAYMREREEQEAKRLLLPIALVRPEQVERWKLFDADRGVDVAQDIREYHIPDFSSWKKHDSYQKALARLIADLKAEGRG